MVVGFAAELRRLRERAGRPGYRELARRAHYSASTLSAAASGHRLPSLEVRGRRPPARHDRKVILWDVASHTRWATLSGHTEEVVSTAWKRDSSRLATGSRDHTVTVWLTDPDEAVAHLCDRLTRDFPAEPTSGCR